MVNSLADNFRGTIFNLHSVRIVYPIRNVLLPGLLSNDCSDAATCNGAETKRTQVNAITALK